MRILLPGTKTSGILPVYALPGKDKHTLKKIVITGGPCAGKTDVLERINIKFGNSVVFVPESATYYYRKYGRIANPTREQELTAQKNIFETAKELERQCMEQALSSGASLVICDRGTVDTKAYWPNGGDRFFKDMGTTEKAEFESYDSVICMRSAAGTGFYQTTSVRIEGPELAAKLDERVYKAWRAHSHFAEIKFNNDFEKKMTEVINHIAYGIR